MSTNQQKVQKELEKLTRDGVIQPHDVVKAASNPKSVLHDMFTWDDSKAAAEYRLYQARQILRTYVVTEQPGTKSTVRAFVSLKQDRQKHGGGYRHIADVLSDDELYQQLLADSLDELRTFQQRYARLKELRPVFDAAEEVERTVQPNEGAQAA